MCLAWSEILVRVEDMVLISAWEQAADHPHDHRDDQQPEADHQQQAADTPSAAEPS